MPYLASNPVSHAPEISTLESRTLFSAVAALTAPSTLLFFDTADPEVVLARIKVRGLARGEILKGIDFRPATGQLFGVSSSSRLFRIDPTTGTATAVNGQLPFNPPLAGTEFGLDFNPAADHLRVISDADNSFRLDPVSGAIIDALDSIAGVQLDLSVAYPQGDPSFGINPAVAAVAHSNNVAGATTTTLFGIDADADTLVRIGSVGGTPMAPASGVLTTIGGLGIDVTSACGFDIDNRAGSQLAYVALHGGGKQSGFYTVNLSTGTATLAGMIAGSKTPIVDIAVVPQGERMVAFDGRNKLVSMDSNLPNIALSSVRLSLLEPREYVVALDRRPSSSVLYALSDRNRLYTVDPSAGTAIPIGDALDVGLRPKLAAGMDFSPVSSQIRVVSAARENLRISPATGRVIDPDPVLPGTQFDGPLAFASTDANWAANPSISAIAHSSNTDGASSTTLYGIDSRLGVLTTIGSPGGSTPSSSGQVFTIGTLGVPVRTRVTLDIVTDGGLDRALATFGDRLSRMTLYAINLTTGQASPIGLLPRGMVPVATAILPPA